MQTNVGRHPSVEYTGESQLLGDEYTEESRHPGDKYSGVSGSEYSGESISNTNNSSNIRKNLKSFLAMSNETRRRCFMKKPK